MNTTHLSEISEKQDGEPVMAVAGEVKYASDINRGTSAKGNDWSRQFFVLAENGTEVGCTLWDADDGSVKKGEHVRFENTQNKKGQWSGITKTSYTDKNQKLVHGLEIRANQVKWNGGDASLTHQMNEKSSHAENGIHNAAPTFNPESAANGVTEARQHLCQAANLYNLCVKAVDKMIAPELPLIAQNSDMFQAATSTLFIESSRAGMIAKMPTKPLPINGGNDKTEEIPGKEEPDWSE